MKTNVVLALLIALLGLTAFLAWPHRGEGVDIGNALCPVTGDVSDPAVFVVYHDMKVRFCCPSCDLDFGSDPVRYLHALRVDSAVARKIDEAEAAWAAQEGK